MLLSATLVLSVSFLIHRFWIMSRFMRGGAKSGRIFFLTAVSGLCLISNIVFPFLLAGAIVSLLELRALVAQG